MDQIMTAINSILTMSETGAIIKIILIIATLGFSAFIGFRSNKWKRDAARKKESEDETAARTQAIKQSRIDNQQVQSDSTRADDFLKGGKNGRS